MVDRTVLQFLRQTKICLRHEPQLPSTVNSHSDMCDTAHVGAVSLRLSSEECATGWCGCCRIVATQIGTR